MEIALYTFESKSIQLYLGLSGRLSDTISLSDRLANFIDDRDESDLEKVLAETHLLEKTDLKDPDNTEKYEIRFTRCKGGAFYCWSNNKADLEKFRLVWTLYFQNALPNMAFTDALVSKEYSDAKDEKATFYQLLDEGFPALGAAINSPVTPLPYATPICQATQKTGMVAVDEEKGNQYTDIIHARTNNRSLNPDTNKYENINPILYKKPLTGVTDGDNEAQRRLRSKFFRTTKGILKDARDIALIHLDGNGFGQLNMNLMNALKKANVEPLKYTKEMRKFSGALESVTVDSVCNAMQVVIDKDKELQERKKYAEAKSDYDFLFRPLVVGGDDVTLLIESMYAFDFTKTFCEEFKRLSEDKIAPVIKTIKDSGVECINPYLTASGGILFNKLAHPFHNSLAIIEGLAEEAKKLTKYKATAKKNYDSV